ncbi:hypothetical protein GLOIN_2v1605120 [Rhizophagus irregularis DAOM 181602=DAOM 197198]|uniref:Uncharacterized protein n=1 Tax=Rhizophagus irregularis (strain DAOM 181602 / DAOM 197198 / MUCL 43194) TaxID=747089 RepID=A0A2P4Q1L5_RHIID|nr:hypothetical protein GLOIN_2v1605120 [Rhizophagus irregularis DAOM 181602=DAOM 197198]POG71531.1 hypothetical protein GLOIN_2v1605120 [Rhizophagus irregularis DAOM 181602=DAOM 197198]GET51278.1 hypothetical protein GLOIN_2v1605120 [Rhizophagus irregularis DAOM 181602=DAOM 197198]|eukprot:XP_025178397.1 hypothetical protein GLOIN_2v1605120 [Rhizophagus irregularis DAOM 181602=DAOM 197198]
MINDIINYLLKESQILELIKNNPKIVKRLVATILLLYVLYRRKTLRERILIIYYAIISDDKVILKLDRLLKPNARWWSPRWVSWSLL